jgi:uncharacterized membrane protein YfcA
MAFGNFRVRPALAIGAVSVIGVEIGVRIAHELPEQTLRRLFGVLLIIVAAQLVWQAFRRAPVP